ncbi:MAG: hypothetical protein ABFQ82_02540 [Thermodesulfobacteriota bacterium]
MFRKGQVIKYLNIGILVVLLMLVGCSAKSNIVTLANGQQAMKVKGKVVSIEVAPGTLVLKPGKGEELVVSFADSTVKMNFGSMGEIKKGKPLEVVYLFNNSGNQAVSIKKLQEASCN